MPRFDNNDPRIRGVQGSFTYQWTLPNRGQGPSRAGDGAYVWLPDMGRINRDDQDWEGDISRGEAKV